MNKQDFIETLQLQPHPEGGYYYETYQSEIKVADKRLYTSIYFLLESGNISHFHRIQSDELWYFHAGHSLTIHMIHPDGRYQSVKLGLDVKKGEVPQYLVPKNTIFASTVEGEDSWSLVGCMVAPGFTFESFELFTQDELIEWYPKHQTIIEKYALKHKENV
ncbi:cupin domain-containing protein [Macrococcus caseolyticus]|uniref:Cupin n=1 Tax=Macrococcoides caseolyticum TaxID=69966 RepID=A0ACC9MU83_9STAP|nr:cupin domain-containing protein [Macrococcus caseolyticus]MDJ1154956.1 cupin domain-containing protein [Macrococcus caseolyticus]MEB8171571.1 cupin domain-containing protein [Macrococcus caseolyticus]PKE39800.1 cupin [Macrococcus caseolyticus]PKE44292.1 cupin [Macrococcus caseolyticus]PKE56980.1 cupin [Macrococcus caseolyticus]